MTQRSQIDPWAPAIENYPPLANWLAERNARCEWQLEREEEVADDERAKPTRSWRGVRVEQWRVNAAIVIVVLRSHRRGWEIYTMLGLTATAVWEIVASSMKA